MGSFSLSSLAGSATQIVGQALQRRTLLPAVVEDRLTGPGRDVAGLVIVVTGASAGIGRETVRRLAADGARVIAVARREDELAALAAETGCDYRVCDLSNEDDVAALIDHLVTVDVDVLINNAGHSIRRRIVDAARAGRFHDYQRTMTLNYFAAVQLSLGLLPGMVDRGRGQIVNVCTWGLMANTFPRFSAYAASKNALAIFGRSLNAERPHPGVRATNVYFPLVRTEMIAPTADYDDAPALSVDDAADWLVHAVRHQPTAVAATALRTLLPVIDYLSPDASDRVIGGLT